MRADRIAIALMTTLLGAYSLLGCGEPAPPMNGGSAPPWSEGSPRRVVVGELEVVTSLDVVEGPKFDTALSRRFYAPRLSDCGRRVVKVATDWARENGYPVLRSELGTRRVQLHLGGGNGLVGYFEVLYRLNPDGRGARTSFTFFDRAGSPAEPSVVNAGASALIDQLQQAIICTD